MYVHCYCYCNRLEMTKLHCYFIVVIVVDIVIVIYKIHMTLMVETYWYMRMWCSFWTTVGYALLSMLSSSFPFNVELTRPPLFTLATLAARTEMMLRTLPLLLPLPSLLLLLLLLLLVSPKARHLCISLVCRVYWVSLCLIAGTTAVPHPMQCAPRWRTSPTSSLQWPVR